MSQTVTFAVVSMICDVSCGFVDLGQRVHALEQKMYNHTSSEEHEQTLLQLAKRSVRYVQRDVAYTCARRSKFCPVLRCIVTPIAAVCNDSNVKEVDFKWKWGDEALLRVDPYAHLGVDVNIKKVTEKGQARIETLHRILADRHPDKDHTTKTRALIPPLKYTGEVWEGNQKVARELEVVDMKGATITLRCSQRTSDGGSKGTIDRRLNARIAK